MDNHELRSTIYWYQMQKLRLHSEKCDLVKQLTKLEKNNKRLKVWWTLTTLVLTSIILILVML